MAVGVGAMLLFSTGCNKIDQFGDTNGNPLGSANPITAALLTNVQSQLGEIVSGILTQGGIVPGLYAQYYSETQYTDAGRYSEPKIDATALYATILNDCQIIINKNSDPATKGAVVASGSNANQIAIAKILKSYIAWTITDRWGDVPYSQALLGAANVYPKYDLQSDIYKQLLTDLKDAVAGFDGGSAMKGDLMYGGDQAKWKKLANTLRMSIALRMSKRFPNPGELAATEFAAAATDVNGFITDNADNFALSFPGGSFKNTWFNTYNGRSDYSLSKTMYDALNGLGDTRKSVFGTNNNAFPYGLSIADANTYSTSVSGNYAKVLTANFRAEDAKQVVVNAATGLLAKAEAIERGWIPGLTTADAQAAYEAAIQQSFAQWGIAVPGGYLAGNASYTAGVGAGSIGQNAFNSIPASSNANTANKIERIQLQRWIALFPDGIQGWSEWRRTDIPHIKPTAFGTNNPKEIPRRFVYGTNEYSLNPASVTEAAGRLASGDKMESRIWWDAL